MKKVREDYNRKGEIVMAELETTATEATETTATVETSAATETEAAENAEIARLRAELAKANNKNDALAKENAAQKKAIRAKQSAEEAAAEEAKETAEAQARELAELRKKFAVAETSKKVMTLVGDEATANTIAEYLYGAEDSDAALAALGKAWSTKEKALRMELGKIPAPGAGDSDGPTVTRAQLDVMGYSERLKFANEHPEEYAKLMGR